MTFFTAIFRLQAHGTEGLRVEGCRLTRVDGQGILLDGYHRAASLRRNHIELTGSHAIVVWGKTSPCLNADCSRTLPDPLASGPDGRGGTQPIGTSIEGNVVREPGVYERHGTMFFSSLAAKTHLKGNVFFNCVRAAVNIQDGFGGGTWLDGNLIANAGRGRNKDEGVVNAWARLPYITSLRNGTDSTEPAANVRHFPAQFPTILTILSWICAGIYECVGAAFSCLRLKLADIVPI